MSDNTPAVYAPEEMRALLARVPQRTLGALVFPGFQILDLWGPLEMLGDCAPAIRPVLVASDHGPIASAQGPRVVPDHAFDDAPRLDLLLIPGGNVGLSKSDETTLSFIRERALDAEIVMSVCNGADLLAQTGLLDGRRATTNKSLFRDISASHRKVHWVTRARWVEDGKFSTSSGVSAGIDMALAVIAKLAGERAANTVARYTEYDRHRDPDWDPFADLNGLGA